MSANDYITDVIANLNNWGIDYSENTSDLTIRDVALEVSEEESAATITDGDNLVAVTSDADKAAALLAFPLARRAWETGYSGDFKVDVCDGFLDMTFSYGSDDVTVSCVVDADSEFTITEHPLFSKSVTMNDLAAALKSAQLAYQDPREAWQVLCGATDFENDDWEALVDDFQRGVRFERGNRLTKVESAYTERVAIVEDWSPESPIRVIDVDTVSDMVCWTMSDAAAAVLYAIS